MNALAAAASLLLAVAAMLLPLTCTETGAQEKKTVAIHGFGSQSCGAWIEARRQRNQVSVGMGSWVLGYITAYNTFEGTGNVLRGTDLEGTLAWIDKHCRDNPTEDLANAVVALIRHLEPR
jgi:hypothetical protein